MTVFVQLSFLFSQQISAKPGSRALILLILLVYVSPCRSSNQVLRTIILCKVTLTLEQKSI